MVGCGEKESGVEVILLGVLRGEYCTDFCVLFLGFSVFEMEIVVC